MATAQKRDLDLALVKALFLEQFGSPLDTTNYQQVTVAIQRFLTTPGSGATEDTIAGFWNGEINGELQRIGVVVFTLDGPS